MISVPHVMLVAERMPKHEGVQPGAAHVKLYSELSIADGAISVVGGTTRVPAVPCSPTLTRLLRAPVRHKMTGG